MTLYLLEKAVDQLYSYLSANIVAKIAALNLRYPDDTLGGISTWYKGSLPIVTPANPSISIHATDLVPVQRMGSTLQVSNGISIVIIIGSDVVEKRFRRLCRYTIGILELLQTGEATIGYKIKLSDRISLTETMATPPFLQGVIIPIVLDQIETY